MTLRMITPPAVEPVSLADAKAHCRVDGADEDSWFSTIAIPAARRAAEHELGRRLVTQTWEAVYDEFPAYGVALAPGVLTIESVKYVATDATEQTLDPAAYVLDAESTPSFALPAAGTAWPATASAANTVRVRFTCGYGATAAHVPGEVRQWILMHIGTAYKMRESLAHGQPVAELPNRYHDRLLDGERTYWSW